MERQIRELHALIAKQKPIIPTIKTEINPDGKIIEHEIIQTFAQYYNIHDETGDLLNFNESEQHRTNMITPLIEQLVTWTNSLLELNGVFRKKLEYGTYSMLKNRYKENMKIQEKYDWCTEVLLALNILTDAKIVTYQVITDENSIPVAVKKEGERKIEGEILQNVTEKDENISDDTIGQVVR